MLDLFVFDSAVAQTTVHRWNKHAADTTHEQNSNRLECSVRRLGLCLAQLRWDRQHNTMRTQAHEACYVGDRGSEAPHASTRRPAHDSTQPKNSKLSAAGDRSRAAAHAVRTQRSQHTTISHSTWSRMNWWKRTSSRYRNEKHGADLVHPRTRSKFKNWFR